MIKHDNVVILKLNMYLHNIYGDMLKIEANGSFGLEATCWSHAFRLYKIMWADWFWTQRMFELELSQRGLRHGHSSGLGLGRENSKVGKYLGQMLRSLTFSQLSCEHSLFGPNYKSGSCVFGVILKTTNWTYWQTN